MAKHSSTMSRKAPQSFVGAMLLVDEPRGQEGNIELPVVASSGMPALSMLPSIQTLQSGVEPSEYPAEPKIEVTLQVKNEIWTAQCLSLGEGGELLADFEKSGVVTADGVMHSGWVIAANEAMMEIRRLRLDGNILVRIPDSRPVGFLRVTLPSHDQAVRISSDENQYCMPAIYEMFLELFRLMRPRIVWAKSAQA